MRRLILATLTTALVALAAACGDDGEDKDVNLEPADAGTLPTCAAGAPNDETHVISISPADGEAPVLRMPWIVVGFQQEIDCESAKSAPLALRGPEGEVALEQVYCGGNPASLELQPKQHLAYQTRYTLSLSGLLNSHGDAIAACQAQFTTKSKTRSVSILGTNALALDEDGTLWSWGDSLNEALDSRGNTADVPQRVPFAKKVVAMAAGDQYDLAALEDGTVWAWGYNLWGQLGNGSTDATGSVSVQVPMTLPAGVTITALAAHERHSLALRSDGKVMAWGSNDSGQLGDGTLDNRLEPVEVQGIADVVAISAGQGTNTFDFSLALESDGTVWGWGGNHDGNLAQDIPEIDPPIHPSPVQITQLSGIRAIAAGTRNGYAIDASGKVFGWGDSLYGALGNDICHDGLAIVPVSARIDGVQALDAGDEYVLAVRDDGTLWGWGYNYDAVLGDGTRGPATTFCNESFPADEATQKVPTQALGISDAVAVSAGEDLALIVRADGSVWGAGYNVNDALGVGDDAAYIEGSWVGRFSQVPGL